MSSPDNTVSMKRPPPPRQGHPKGMLITVMGLALGLLFVVGSIKEMVKLRHVRQDLYEARQEEARLTRIKKNLKARERDLHDPAVIEEEARKLGMVRRDEVPIQISKPSAAKTPPKPQAKSAKKEKPKTLWQRVLDWFK